VIEPVWLDAVIAEAIQFDQVRTHGGSHGVRDPGLPDSALSRPRNCWAYNPQVQLVELAAEYGFGIARNHPFVDGNKRVAFMAMYTFLAMNGVEIVVPEPEAVVMTLRLAAGEMTLEGLVQWLSANVQPLDQG